MRLYGLQIQAKGLWLRSTRALSARFLLLAACAWSAAAEAASHTPNLAAPAAAPAQFLDNDSRVETRLSVSLAVSLAIVAAGAIAIGLGKKRRWFEQAPEIDAQLKVLKVQRVTGKLTVVLLETTDGQRVAFADNGAALLLLTLSGSGTVPDLNSKPS